MSDEIQERSRSIAELGLAADLRTEPWNYPGPFLPFSCLQEGDQLLPLQAQSDGQVTVTADGRRKDLVLELRRRTRVDLRECQFVIAIGSNASPDVVRRKFERKDASTTILHVLGRLDGVALGYSAHVSPAGYVPVAPYPRALSPNVVVSALTEEQLRCLDETEPNYVRMTIPSGGLHLSLPVELPPGVHIYESKWGILVDGAEMPLPFGTQGTIFDQLAAWRVLPPPIAIADGTPCITRTLGGKEELRARIRDNLAQHSKQFRTES